MEYIRDFFRDSSIEQPIRYSLEKPDLYQEESPIYGSTFQLDKYTDEFLEKLFEDIYKIPI